MTLARGDGTDERKWEETKKKKKRSRCTHILYSSRILLDPYVEANKLSGYMAMGVDVVRRGGEKELEPPKASILSVGREDPVALSVSRSQHT